MRSALSDRFFVSAQWYNRPDHAGAIYVGGWSLHWCLRGPVIVNEAGQVETLRERPWRALVLYRRVLYKVFAIRLWPARGWCEHGFRRDLWWHRCDYVTDQNPDGRPSDEELLEEYEKTARGFGGSAQ